MSISGTLRHVGLYLSARTAFHGLRAEIALLPGSVLASPSPYSPCSTVRLMLMNEPRSLVWLGGLAS
jgi:hypothetical protein